jgi:hypothetical protein
MLPYVTLCCAMLCYVVHYLCNVPLWQTRNKPSQDLRACLRLTLQIIKILHIGWGTWCYSGVIEVLRWYYSGAMVVLWWCYGGVTVVLRWCYGGVTVVLRWCCSGVPVMLQ